MAAPSPSHFEPDIEQLRATLTPLLLDLKFGEVLRVVVMLVVRLRDLNTELVKRLAHLTRPRPRSETLERLEAQLLLPLFAQAAKPRNADEATPPAKKKSKREKPQGSGRRSDFPAHLERVPVHNWLTPEQRVCPLCGEPMKLVSHAPCERYNVIPARIVVEQRWDETVACKNDDTIVSAAAPASIVEGGILGNELVIEATCDKFIDHLPIERQCARWVQAGAHISPATLGRSVAAHIELLRPISDAIIEQTRGPGYLATDATGIPILDPTTDEGIRNGSMWCWTNAYWVAFFYSPRADADCVDRFLGGDRKRVVQGDGTSVLNCIEKAGGLRPGCWSHGRRGFVLAARGGDTLALKMVRLIAPLFKIERDAKLAGETALERKERRQRCSAPVVAEIRAFLDEQRALVPPKTTLGKALGYLHRQWKRLILFLDDGNIELTNNRRERELRKLVQGRKNWLFTWKDVGGERTASILTILATCVSFELNPRAYLHVVTKHILNGWPKARLRELLPDQIVQLHPELAVVPRADAE